MKRQESRVQTWIQGLESEHYLSRQPITGQWNNSGDEILKKMHKRRQRAELLAMLKSALLIGAGILFAVLAGWTAF